MAIVKAWHQHLAVHVDDFSIRADEWNDFLVGADKNNLTVGYRDRLSPGAIVIDCINSATSEYRVGARRRHAACAL